MRHSTLDRETGRRFVVFLAGQIVGDRPPAEALLPRLNRIAGGATAPPGWLPQPRPGRKEQARDARKAAEDCGDSGEGEPALFEGSALGEGRAASFTAAGGGPCGGQARGLRVASPTDDRRISAPCEARPAQSDGYQPAFLAFCRGLAR